MEELKKYIYERFGLDSEIIFNLSKHELEDLKKQIQEIIKKKYPKRKGRLLGTMSKAMPHNIYIQLLTYFKKEKKDKIALAVQVAGTEGARVGDLVELTTENLDFSNHLITFYNHKNERFYTIPLDSELEISLKKFIQKHKQEIKNHQNYIFYSSEFLEKKNHLHINKNSLRNIILKALTELNLTHSYALASDGRNLHIFSFHSLRGHSATRIYKLSNHSLQVTAELLNHSPRSLETTNLYIENQENELYKIMRNN